MVDWVQLWFMLKVIGFVLVCAFCVVIAAIITLDKFSEWKPRKVQSWKKK